MGRNLLRRQIVAILITVSAGPIVSSTADTPPSPLAEHPSIRAVGFTPLSTHETVASPQADSIIPLLQSENTDSIPLYDHPLVRYYLEQYSNRYGIDYIRKSLERAKPFRSFIRETIRAAGAPEELFYLPVIESAYLATAVSKSGARGLWQFMVNSIGPYGMKITDWIDERNDPWKSTEGAVKLLLSHYRALGDWYLALAAYNCGLGRVTRAMKESGKKTFTELADGGFLPNETVHYVPKFVAIAWLAEKTVRSLDWEDWNPDPEWERIPVHVVVDLALLAKTSGVPLAELKTGNPELIYGITPPVEGKNTHYLKVPAGKSAAITEAIRNSPQNFVRCYIHTIGAGDTFYGLSRHFGVSIAMIQTYNPGVRPEALRVGNKLIIPALNEVGPYTGPPPPVKKETGPVEPWKYFEKYEFYTISAGDTYWGLAKKYGISPEVLAKANGLTTDTVLNTGQIISVPKIDPQKAVP